MKLVYPKDLTDKQARAYRLCLSQSKINLRKNDAISALVDGVHAVEKGVSFADRNLPISDLGRIDLLAVDILGCPIIINVAEELDASILCRFFVLYDWIKEHAKTFEHFYRGLTFGQGMRMWVFAGEVLPEVHSLLLRIKENFPEVFEYQGLSLANGEWCAVRKVKNFGVAAQIAADSALQSQAKIKNGERDSGVPEALFVKNDARPPKHALSIHSVLTDDEINGFFDQNNSSEGVTDDVTSRLVL